MSQGKCLIFSAPSGSGKTTLVNHLMEIRSDLRFSVSATTRQPRDYEVSGKHYYFIEPQEFRERIQRDEFVEWEEVYSDIFYGTLKEEVERIRNEGFTVIFDVDVVGGANLKEIFKTEALAVFVKVGSIEELEKRLRKRGSETDDSLKQRLSKAKEELGFEKKFDVTIINDDLQKAYDKVTEVVSEYLDNQT